MEAIKAPRWRQANRILSPIHTIHTTHGAAAFEVGKKKLLISRRQP